MNSVLSGPMLRTSCRPYCPLKSGRSLKGERSSAIILKVNNGALLNPFARPCSPNISTRAYYTAAFLCSAAILFLRSYRTFLHPVAGWEDATQGLNYYTSSSPTVLHFYAGYVSFLPNLVDWASVKLLPLQAVPFVQGYFALGTTACIAPALMSFLRNVVQWQPSHAAIAGIVITCLPWGDVAAISNAEFSIWSLLVILLLTSLNPVKPSLLGISCYVLWRIAILASTPVAIVCAPTWCFLCRR